MSKGKVGGRGSQAHVEVTVNILHTIAEAIYSTEVGKVREAVANARDNGASCASIVVDPVERKLSILDNGNGITREMFEKIFRHIGYGLLQGEGKIGYFGLGLMSVFKLGGRVRLFTRPRGQRNLELLTVDTAAIFAEGNRKKPISFLEECITLDTATESQRARESIPLVNEQMAVLFPAGSMEHFTEIIISNIREDVLEEICQPEFVVELSKTLPLRAEKDEPFFKKFSKKKAEEIRKILEDDRFCSAIDVYFGNQQEGEVDQIWKYFPRFQVTFPDDNVYVGIGPGEEFAYYLVHTLAENLNDARPSDEGLGDQSEEGKGFRSSREQRRDDSETGFWIRNGNFLVKAADFLDRPGPGRPPRSTIDRPLRNWVFGEIFHKDMNKFLAVSRTEFLYAKGEFKAFRDNVCDLAAKINSSLRMIWDNQKDIHDGLVKPFEEIDKPSGALRRAENRIRMMLGEALPEQKFQSKVGELLGMLRNKAIEQDNARIDKILECASRPMILGEDEKVLVQIAPALAGKADTSELAWDRESERVVLSISPSLFKPKEVRFLGRGFSLYFVAQRERDPGISVNVDKHALYINPFSKDLRGWDLSAFDVYFALEVAYAMSGSKDEMRKNLLDLLGQPSKVADYVGVLGDDLRQVLALG
jgi:hypothetical protein